MKPYPRPKVIIRVDDGARFLLNEDDGTYTMEQQKETMPTTYYRYTYEQLMVLHHGNFDHD